MLEGIRMIRPGVLIVAMLVCSVMALSAETLPATEGENLLGQKVKIADSLKGKAGVLVIGYSKSAGEITAAWDKRLSADYGSNPAVTIYQIPMLEAAPKFIRGTIISGMKKGVPAAKQGNFIVVVKDEDEWKRVSGFQKSDEAYVLIVDKSGEIQQHSPVDAKLTSYSSVHQQIEKLISK
jgi:hypothetical protein